MTSAPIKVEVSGLREITLSEISCDIEISQGGGKLCFLPNCRPEKDATGRQMIRVPFPSFGEQPLTIPKEATIQLQGRSLPILIAPDDESRLLNSYLTSLARLCFGVANERQVFSAWVNSAGEFGVDPQKAAGPTPDMFKAEALSLEISMLSVKKQFQGDSVVAAYVYDGGSPLFVTTHSIKHALNQRVVISFRNIIELAIREGCK